MTTNRFSTKSITENVVANNPGISEFLHMEPKVQKFYTTLADTSIGIPRNERRELNRTLKSDFGITKIEAFQLLNFIKFFILAA
jgi:hypothetical protein